MSCHSINKIGRGAYRFILEFYWQRCCFKERKSCLYQVSMFSFCTLILFRCVGLGDMMANSMFLEIILKCMKLTSLVSLKRDQFGRELSFCLRMKFHKDAEDITLVLQRL